MSYQNSLRGCGSCQPLRINYTATVSGVGRIAIVAIGGGAHNCVTIEHDFNHGEGFPLLRDID